jgi:Family of unknown function (DUF6370)
MTKFLSLITISLLLLSCSTTQHVEMVDQVVETACGVCTYEMTGDGCELAVKIDGKYYYVEGTKINEHGDCHAEDGFCNRVRKAKVTGQIKHGVFVVKSYELLPL